MLYFCTMTFAAAVPVKGHEERLSSDGRYRVVIRMFVFPRRHKEYIPYAYVNGAWQRLSREAQDTFTDAKEWCETHMDDTR